MGARMEEQDAWIEECVELLQQLETLNSGRDFASQSELRERGYHHRERIEDDISRLRSRLTERLNGHRLETEVLTPCLDVASVSPLCGTNTNAKEVKLPTEVWAKIAGMISSNDVCSFALSCKQMRQAQLMAGRRLSTRPTWAQGNGTDTFTEDWCKYWSRKFNVRETRMEYNKAIVYIASRHGYLGVLQKYWSTGPEDKLCLLWDAKTCVWSAFGGHLETLKWLRAMGCPWDVSTCAWAAQGGHLALLRWAHLNGAPWDANTCAYAAKAGNLDVLAWARSQNPPCPWDSTTCRKAAENGHLDVLKWCRRQSRDVCPWNEYLCVGAARGGHLHVLQWAVKEGCPWSRAACREAALEKGHREVVEWIDD